MANKKTYGKDNDLNLKSLIALSRSFQWVRKRELITLRKGGLTMSQFAVLEILYHKGDLRIAEIIEGTLSTGGNMTLVIDNLKKEAFVLKKTDPKDGRVSLISITDKGRDYIEAIFPEHVKNIGKIFEVLSEKEKNHLIQLLKKLSSGA